MHEGIYHYFLGYGSVMHCVAILCPNNFYKGMNYFLRAHAVRSTFRTFCVRIRM